MGSSGHISQAGREQWPSPGRRRSQVGRPATRSLTVVLLLIWAMGVFSTRAEVLYMPLNGLQLARNSASGIGCANNLKQILLGAQSWSMDHADQPPPDFASLTNDLQSPAVLFCPANLSLVPTNWGQLEWNKIDYELLSVTNWANLTNVVVRCRIHNSGGQAQGSVLIGGFRTGWPYITAGPFYALATPNQDIHLAVKVATDAVQPLHYQWRREHLSFTTNVVRVNNPDDPTGSYWQTNVVPTFTATNLAGQTNAALFLASVQTNDSGYYSVAVSNALGASVSQPSSLRVDPALAGISTNEHWAEVFCLNNLRMIGFARSIWSIDHGDQPAGNLLVLTNSESSHLLGWPVALFCRSDTNRTAPPDWPEIDFSNTSYELVSTDFENSAAPFCRCRAHGFYLEMGGAAVKQPSLTAITPLAGNGFNLTFRVFAGRTNLLQASNDLATWTALTNYSGTYGDFQYIDSEPHSERFYRLRLP